MIHEHRGLFGALIGAALLSSAPRSAHPDTLTFVSGPSVSSPTAGRYTVIARKGDNRFYSVDRNELSFFGGAVWNTQGWYAIPGVSDFNSDPDSAVSMNAQWVVGRRASDNGCWYARRGFPTGSGSDTQFPQWSAWNPCGGVFHSGLSLATDNQGSYSVLHVFGRGTDDGIYHRMFYDGPGLGPLTDWTLISSTTDDSSAPAPTKGFDSDPDAVVYDTPSGTKVGVCGHRTNGYLYCNNYDMNRGTWAGWKVMGLTKASAGPGLTAGVDANSYDVFYDRVPNDPNGSLASSIGAVAWSNDAWRFPIPAPPAVSSISDPDAATFVDTVNNNMRRRLVCTRLGTNSLIQCAMSYGTQWGTWFTPYSNIEITPAASAVTASTDDSNVPGNTVDDNLATRWSGNGDGVGDVPSASLQLDLGTTRRVGYLKIATYRGDTRSGWFDLQVATVKDQWTNVRKSGQPAPQFVTSGTTTAEETFDFDDVDARWVRYVGYGAQLKGGGTTTWNGVTEISVWGR